MKFLGGSRKKKVQIGGKIVSQEFSNKKITKADFSSKFRKYVSIYPEAFFYP